MSYRLLTEFESLFRHKPYKHRNSTLGDWVAIHLYEDLAGLDRFPTFSERVRLGQRVRTGTNRVQGLRSRRGDGTFGQPVPNDEPVFDTGYQVARAPTATIEIGVEVKILAKAMIKQIDRVCSDLREQVRQFQSAGGRPISVGIVGINSADHYVGFEGDRQFPTTGRGGFKHPFQEADEAEQRLARDARPAYDHFLFLRFRATNVAPFPFEWVNSESTQMDYGALLVRLGAQYEERLG